MLGQLPVQYYIIRFFCRFWNRMLNTAQLNPLVQECIRTQVDMLTAGHTCWLKHWDTRLGVATPRAAAAHIHLAIRQLDPIDVRLVQNHMADAYQAYLAGCGDPLDPHCQHRRTATTYRLFLGSGKVGRKPTWLAIDWARLPDRTWLDWTRLASTFADLPVHRFGDMDTPFAQRVCTKCMLGEPGNEQHMLFRCSATAHARDEFMDALTWNGQDDLARLVDRNVTDSSLPMFVSKALRDYHSAPVVTVRG